MKLVLVYRDEELGQAWRAHFATQSEVTLSHGDICEVKADAVVSPANSFGFMDGGLDLALSDRLGWHVQDSLQKAIREKHAGELLVGQAEIVPTGDSQVPWLISAPTMRVPMRIRESINAYLAMRAVLLATRTHSARPPIETVAVPGLGTGVGGLDYDTAAFQMWAAYEEIVLGKVSFPEDIGRAADQHLGLNKRGRLFD